MELTEKDVERLKKLLESIEKGTATTFEKNTSIEAIKGILEPKCAVCRGLIQEGLTVVNGRKMHEKCRLKYKGWKNIFHHFDNYTEKKFFNKKYCI